MMISELRQILGIEWYRVSHTERLASVAGAFCGIFGVLIVSNYFVEGQAAYLVVASMGASAVLLFAVPHGALSQPWALVGGHLVSAVIGVTCARYISEPFVAAALAVALAVGAMHYLRCIHPPGGATALSAVVGGPAIADLGYTFIEAPVMLNVVVILTIAILFNALFHWRRYPSYFSTRRTVAARETGPDAPEHVTREDFVCALSEIDTIVDVTESDLVAIYDLVTTRMQNDHIDVSKLQLGHCYSNGKYGDQWSVRQIVDWSGDSGHEKSEVIYKIIAGPGRRKSAVETAAEFARWAKYEVYRDEENWRRVSTDGAGTKNA